MHENVQIQKKFEETRAQKHSLLGNATSSTLANYCIMRQTELYLFIQQLHKDFPPLHIYYVHIS